MLTSQSCCYRERFELKKKDVVFRRLKDTRFHARHVQAFVDLGSASLKVFALFPGFVVLTTLPLRKDNVLMMIVHVRKRFNGNEAWLSAHRVFHLEK